MIAKIAIDSLLIQLPNAHEFM